MRRMSIEIRVQREYEWDAVLALIDDAFTPAAAPRRLAERIRRSPGWIPGLSFVATDTALGGDPVGQVVFSTVALRTDDEVIDVLTLTPLAVAAPYRGRGVARRLVEHGLAVCAGRSEPLVVLEGDPAMYARLGFRPAAPARDRAAVGADPGAGVPGRRAAGVRPRTARPGGVSGVLLRGRRGRPVSGHRTAEWIATTPPDRFRQVAFRQPLPSMR